MQQVLFVEEGAVSGVAKDLVPVAIVHSTKQVPFTPLVVFNVEVLNTFAALDSMDVIANEDRVEKKDKGAATSDSFSSFKIPSLDELNVNPEETMGGSRSGGRDEFGW